MDQETQRAKGFAHIEFASNEAAKKALEMNGQDLDGRNVKVDLSAPRTGGASRGGRGGFGGGRGRGGSEDRGAFRGFGGRGGRGGFEVNKNRGDIAGFEGTKKKL
jgi:nucleolin